MKAKNDEWIVLYKFHYVTLWCFTFFRSPSCMYTTRQPTNKKLMKMTIKWWSIDITVITGFIKPIINKRYCTIIYSVSGFCIKTQHGQKL